MITRPTLIINEKICRNNIRRMLEKAKASDVIFRPHFKTHQSTEVAEWFKDYEVEKITVSSAEMAHKFADEGWMDITIAFPVNIREIDIYNNLASRIGLNLLSDSVEATEALAKSLHAPAGLFIEIDCAYGRSGISYDKHDAIDAVISEILKSEKLIFKGFLLHSGDTYHAGNPAEIEDIYKRDILRLQGLKERYIEEYPDIVISVGDTPACTIVDQLDGADEIRPGNFVYYDLMQYALGVCKLSDIAAIVLCPVSGIYPERNEIVIYGGAVHLSKEFLDKHDRYFGLVVRYSENGNTQPIPDTKLISISQEHGVIKTTDGFLQTIKHGDLIGILPVHSCLTANLLRNNTIFV